MKVNRRFMLVLVLLVGAALWLWSPGKTGQRLLKFDNAGEMLSAAQETMGEVKNYKYKTDIMVGDQIKVSFQNSVVREEPGRQMIDFSWSAPNMKGTAAMYAEGEKIILYNPLKKRWEMPAEEPALSPFLGYFWRQVNLADPVENLLKADVHGKNISVVKDQTEQVKDTVTIQLVPDEKALSELSKSLPPQFIGAELKDLKQLFRISKNDFLVSRYEVQATVSFFGVKTMTFKTISIPSDYNKTKLDLPQQLIDKLGQTKTP